MSLKQFKVPGRGDLVWLDFTPQAGHEQAGRRPAVVLTESAYNKKTGLAVVCPITTQAKGYPFEVSIPACLPIVGVVLADHVHNVDWNARRCEVVGTMPADTLDDVLAKLNASLY
ncbi:MAG: endoribonuclease MazF [Opitutaceae bacterium]